MTVAVVVVAGSGMTVAAVAVVAVVVEVGLVPSSVAVVPECRTVRTERVAERPLPAYFVESSSE